MNPRCQNDINHWQARSTKILFWGIMLWPNVSFKEIDVVSWTMRYAYPHLRWIQFHLDRHLHWTRCLGTLWSSSTTGHGEFGLPLTKNKGYGTNLKAFAIIAWLWLILFRFLCLICALFIYMLDFARTCESFWLRVRFFHISFSFLA